MKLIIGHSGQQRTDLDLISTWLNATKKNRKSEWRKLTIKFPGKCRLGESKAGSLSPYITGTLNPIYLNCQMIIKENWKIIIFKPHLLRGTFNCERFSKAA